MSGKPLELPPAVARNFVRDMRAYFAEKNGIKADGIAARQLQALRQHYTGNEAARREGDVSSDARRDLMDSFEAFWQCANKQQSRPTCTML
jgi:hypothetical protein